LGVIVLSWAPVMKFQLQAMFVFKQVQVLFGVFRESCGWNVLDFEGGLRDQPA